MSEHPAGDPAAARMAEELADLRALVDGSRWTYSAAVGGYVSLDDAHLDVICRSAAAVIEHTGGNVVPISEEE